MWYCQLVHQWHDRLSLLVCLLIIQRLISLYAHLTCSWLYHQCAGAHSPNHYTGLSHPSTSITHTEGIRRKAVGWLWLTSNGLLLLTLWHHSSFIIRFLSVMSHLGCIRYSRTRRNTGACHVRIQDGRLHSKTIKGCTPSEGSRHSISSPPSRRWCAESFPVFERADPVSTKSMFPLSILNLLCHTLLPSNIKPVQIPWHMRTCTGVYHAM